MSCYDISDSAIAAYGGRRMIRNYRDLNGDRVEETGQNVEVKRRSMDTVPAWSALELPAIFIRTPEQPVTKIVVGVNSSGGSAAALRWAVAEACRREALLRIVSTWESAGPLGSPLTGDPARIAAARVQKALVRVLSQQCLPCRIGCATLKGAPGEALLSEAGEAGLLVLGAAGPGPEREPGPTHRYCLQNGHGPLVFVPAWRLSHDPGPLESSGERVT